MAGGTAIGDERARIVLRAAVETYIQSASPVASRTLNRAGVPMSSAAIRAVMADLETDGLLVKPHTSAGRIPSSRGYRAYVDHLLELALLTAERRTRLEQTLERDRRHRRQLEVCARALAEDTGLVAFAIAAPRARERYHRLELVRLRVGEILAIFATRVGAVHHRRVELDADVSPAELERIQNFLDGRFEGMTFAEIQSLVADGLDEAEKTGRSTLESRAYALTQRVLPMSETPGLDFVVAGQHHLLQYPEFTDASLAEPVFAALEAPETWAQLRQTVTSQPDIVAVIGDENDTAGLRHCAVVAASVPWEEDAEGTIGLLGPTRLSYGAVIALIDYARRYVHTWTRRRYAA